MSYNYIIDRLMKIKSDLKDIECYGEFAIIIDSEIDKIDELLNEIRESL